FMIYGMLALFVANSDVSFSDLQNPGPVFAVFAVMLAIVVIGAVAPRKVNFLFGMRYYAGNWDTTLWLMTPAAREKLERSIVCIPPIPAHLAHHMTGGGDPDLPLYVGYAFRAMNTHGRALFTLAHRAVDPDHVDDYVITDGEVIASLAVGWNFGDGHFADERLVAALQRRAHFDPGEVRIVMLDSQAMHRQVQHYRIVDAATGVVERGTVSVADIAARQPWDDTVPVQVIADRP
ncbi:MAG: DUF3556 domain-containing protein, partial [Williamsia herbipolensis]|nr:DUF3556 domain-containing protein [Williamsia herbipolensis]